MTGREAKGVRRKVGRRLAVGAAALCLTVPFGATAGAAPPQPAWTRTLAIDVSLGSVAVDRAGDVYVTGMQGRDETAAVLEKFDPDGTLLWTRTWSRPEAHADGRLVAVAPDGSVYFAGRVGSLHFEGGAWFLRRYTPDGTLVWARAERGWQHGRTADSPTGLAVAGNQVVLAGSFQGCCGDFRIRDGWVLAFGTDGSHRWRSPFEAAGLGAFSDEADSVAVGAGGGIYVGGWAALGPESEEVAAPHELFLQRLARDGRVVWSRTYPETAHLDQDFGVDLAVHRDALIVTALVDGVPVDDSFARPGHAWLARSTLAGDLVWSRTWGTSWTAASEPAAVSVGAGGGIVVAGTRRDPSDHGLDAFLRGFSSSGRLRWSVRLQRGHRLIAGSDVAWGPHGLVAAAEALKMRFGAGLRGYLWGFAGH